MTVSAIIISESGGGGGGGRAKGGKGMGMGKGHKARRREQEADAASQSNILTLDPDASVRTHMLFPRGKEDAPDVGQNQTFFQNLTSGRLFGNTQRGLPFGGNVSVPPGREEDPFTRGKQVTFDNDDRFPSMEKQVRPERRPNSYHCEKPARGGLPEKPPFTSLQEPYR